MPHTTDHEPSDYDILRDKLARDDPQLSVADRLLLVLMLDQNATMKRAASVQRHHAAGAPLTKDPDGAFGLAAEECYCSPSTAARAYYNQLDLQHFGYM